MKKSDQVKAGRFLSEPEMRIFFQRHHWLKKHRLIKLVIITKTWKETYDKVPLLINLQVMIYSFSNKSLPRYFQRFFFLLGTPLNDCVRNYTLTRKRHPARSECFCLIYLIPWNLCFEDRLFWSITFCSELKVKVKLTHWTSIYFLKTPQITVRIKI